MMAKLVYDFGNARGKCFDPRRSYFEDFRHAVAFLDEGDWKNAVGRGKPPKGIVRVNGQAIAVGDIARRYIIAERPKGAARYKPTYYGVVLGYALSEVFQKSMSNITLIASHAPGDINYAERLKQAAAGVWEVESRHGALVFQVRDVKTFDEPIGGYSHYVFTERGEERKKNQLRDATTLVVDVGGHTVDVAAVDPGGEIDPLSLNSTRTGVIKLTTDFETMLRANNPTMFQDSGDLDIKRVENAILTGVYQFGRVPVPCKVEAQQVKSALVNDVIQVINAAGGAANYDYVLLTGGGAALIVEDLQAAYPRIDFLMAEPDRELMKYANVFGGAKLATLLENIGAW
jgi:hypothetical protein